jgi:hypothetical protein
MTLIGGAQATEAQVRASETPPETKSHKPLAHGELIDYAQEVLRGKRWEILEQSFSLSAGTIGGVKWSQARMFGAMTIAKEDVVTGDEYQLAIGIRNAHDKRMTAGMVAGLYVMVCSNLDFMGEFKVSRKHTVNIRRDLPAQLWTMANDIDNEHSNHRKVIDSYKARELSVTESHDLVVQCADRGVFPWQFGEKVLKEYRNPRHEVFEDRTVWSFNNATTEILKARNTNELPRSMARFHALAGEIILN